MARILVHGFGRGSGSAAPTPPPPYEYFLDEYSGAGRAYSLRRLREDYFELPAITVRRDSDDTTQDIGFVDNVLDTGSLLTFVGTGSGYIRRWYDQSGTGNNANQSTDGFQPVIVKSGSLVTENGKPAIDFGIADDDTLIFSIFTPSTIILVARSYGASAILNYALGSTPGGIGFDGIYTGDGITPNTIFAAGSGGGSVLPTSISGRTQTLFQLYADTAVDSGSIYIANSLEANDDYIPLALTNIGNRGGSSFALSGSVQEVIMYSTDESATQTGQYTNLDNFYS